MSRRTSKRRKYRNVVRKAQNKYIQRREVGAREEDKENRVYRKTDIRAEGRNTGRKKTRRIFCLFI